MLFLDNGVFGFATFKSYPLSISELKKNEFKLYPNPVTDKLFLNATNTAANLNIQIFNIEGKLLSIQDVALQDQKAIDVSQLKSGIYFLNIEDQNGNTAVKKFIKD